MYGKDENIMQVKATISKKNLYWISRHRYYELKHFCLQYPEWVKERNNIDGLQKTQTNNIKIDSSAISNPTENSAEKREYYNNRIHLVEEASKKSDMIIGIFILKGVTEGISYNYLRNQLNIPCSRDVYYDLYRKFFWILNKTRM